MIRSFACIALLTATVFAREEFEVGSKGATLTLEDGWTRHALVSTLGKDQFVHTVGRNGASVDVAIVIECSRVVDVEADHRQVLEQWASGLDRKNSPTPAGEFEFHAASGSEGPAWSRLAYDFTPNTVKQRSIAHVVARNGLAYLILFVGDAARATDVGSEATSVRRAFAFPDAKSPWGRSTRRRMRMFRIDDTIVRITHSPSEIDAKRVASGPLLSLVSEHKDVIIHFLPGAQAREPSALNAVIDGAVSAVGCDAALEPELARTSLEIGGKPALRETRAMPGNENQLVDLIAVQVNDLRTLDLRIIYPRPLDSVSGIRKRLIESIVIEPPRPLDAYSPPKPAPCRKPPTPEWAAVLGASKLATTLDGSLIDADAADDGRLTITTPTAVLRFESDWSASRAIYGGTKSSGRSAVVMGDRILTQGDDALVDVAADGTTKPAGFEAARLSGATSEGIVLLRMLSETKGARPFGYLRADPPMPIGILVRRSDGTERSVTTWSPVGCIESGIDASGKELAIAIRDDRAPSAAPVELFVVDLATGVRKGVKRFAQLREIARADAGWLVTGTPEGERTGIWEVKRDGASELLLGGLEPIGIGLVSGRLLFATTFAIDAVDADWYFHSIALDDARRLGGACAIPSPQSLRTLARDAIAKCGASSPSAAIESKAAIDGFLAAADALAKEHLGCDLPTAPDRVDAWLRVVEWSRGSQTCGGEGTALLTALVVRALATAGGQWVDGAPADSPCPVVARTLFIDSDFAVGVVATEFVATAIDSDAKQSTTVANLCENVLGRELFVSGSRSALESAIAKVSAFDLLDSASRSDRDVGELEKGLLAAVDNLYVRNAVYNRLANDGDIEALLHITGTFLKAGDSAAYLDRLTAIVARNARLADGGPGDPSLIADARALAEEFAYTADAFVQLARAYEISGGDDAKDLAKICYAHAIDLGANGRVLDDAKAGIERCKQP